MNIEKTKIELIRLANELSEEDTRTAISSLTTADELIVNCIRSDKMSLEDFRMIQILAAQRMQQQIA